MRIKILGAAAGGGLPQWNCTCSNCLHARTTLSSVRPRTQSQLAVSEDGEDWVLINASPDLRQQLQFCPELYPNPANGIRNTPVAGVILTSADLDHVLGLLLMREFTSVQIYATATVTSILQSNSFFTMLDRVPNQGRWTAITPGTSFEPIRGLQCTPLSVPGSLPAYVKTDAETLRNAKDATTGLLLEDTQARVAYLPAFPAISTELKEVLATCTAIFVDGTFWSDDELQRVQPGTPSARSMGHLPISGPDGSLANLSRLGTPRKIYTHINNTNPILDEDSPEFRAVREAGWEIATDGLEMTI